MKSALALVPALALIAAFAPAQEKTQEQLVALREEKLSKTVFQKAEWMLDYDAARAKAKAAGKPIFAYFTRSYAHCGPCEMLESSLLSTPEFVEFSKSSVLFLHVTSRVADEPYPKLLSEKGFGGFPSICFLDADGNVTVRNLQREIGSLTHARAQLDQLAALRARVAAAAAKDAVDAEAARDLLFVEMDLQMVTPEQVRDRTKAMQLADADRERIERFLVDAEVRVLRGKARELGADEIGKLFAAMVQTARLPSAENEVYFWQMVLGHAAKVRDAELAQRAFDVLEKHKQPATLRERNRALLEQAKGSKQ